MSDLPKHMEWFLELSDGDQTMSLIHKIEKYLNIKVSLTVDKDDNDIFADFVRSYDNDFVKFANDWIDDKTLKNTYIEYCKRKRIRNLFKKTPKFELTQEVQRIGVLSDINKQVFSPASFKTLTCQSDSFPSK